MELYMNTNEELSRAINRFVILCVEQYASKVNKSSRETYTLLNSLGIINELESDYQDMHGMSTEMINEYIDERIKSETK